MSNKSVHLQPVAHRIVLLISRSELLINSLTTQFSGSAGFRLCRWKDGADPGLDHALYLIDVGSVSPEESLRMLRLADDKPIALVNATPQSALPLMEKHPWINGVFYRGASHPNLQSGVNAILSGGDWLPRPLMEKLVARYRLMARSNELISLLSDREKQILRLAGQGLSNVDIAKQVYLSIHTVKSHVHNALQKLGAANRAQASSMILGHPDENN